MYAYHFNIQTATRSRSLRSHKQILSGRPIANHTPSPAPSDLVRSSRHASTEDSPAPPSLYPPPLSLSSRVSQLFPLHKNAGCPWARSETPPPLTPLSLPLEASAFTPKTPIPKPQQLLHGRLEPARCRQADGGVPCLHGLRRPRGTAHRHEYVAAPELSGGFLLLFRFVFFVLLFALRFVGLVAG